MKLFTEREQVRSVLDSWKRQYPRPKADKAAITKALAGLDTETATAADVEAIIGNKSWCCPQPCDECKAETFEVVRIGQEPDYESSTAFVCRACLVKALALLGSSNEGGA